MKPSNNQIHWKGENRLLPQVTDISSGQSPRQSLTVLKPCGWKTTGTRKPQRRDSPRWTGRPALWEEGWGRLSCKTRFDFCVQRNCGHIFKGVVYVWVFQFVFFFYSMSLPRGASSRFQQPCLPWCPRGLRVSLLLPPYNQAHCTGIFHRFVLFITHSPCYCQAESARGCWRDLVG